MMDWGSHTDLDEYLTVSLEFCKNDQFCMMNVAHACYFSQLNSAGNSDKIIELTVKVCPCQHCYHPQRSVGR